MSTNHARKDLRAPINIWVRNLGKNEIRLWLDEDTVSSDFTFCYTTQDLSEGGLFLESDAPLPLGAELEIEISFPGQVTVKLRAAVKWIRSSADAAAQGLKPGMGLEYIAPSPEARTAIRKFLKLDL